MSRNIRKRCFASQKHAYIFLTPLKLHLYTVKLGFIWVYIVSLISAQNINCGYSLEPPRRGGSNEFPQSMCSTEYEKYQHFLSETFHLLVVKCSVYLNRHVFVMGDVRSAGTKIIQRIRTICSDSWMLA